MTKYICVGNTRKYIKLYALKHIYTNIHMKLYKQGNIWKKKMYVDGLGPQLPRTLSSLPSDTGGTGLLSYIVIFKKIFPNNAYMGKLSS